jgi:hypothetical protein
MTHMGLYPSEPAVMMLRLVSRDPDDQLIHTILNILLDPESCPYIWVNIFSIMKTTGLRTEGA